MSSPTAPSTADRLNGSASASLTQTGHYAHAAEPLKPQYPLVNWADTRQNAVCIAFLLGCVFATALSSAAGIYKLIDTASWVQWQRRLIGALQSPRLGVYVSLLVIFHMSEFLTTAIYNPRKATVRSFLMDDRHHNAAHFFAFTEFLLEETFLPQKWLNLKQSYSLLWAGLTLAIAAQTVRSVAMITAATNFSHLVVYTKAPEHSLVRSGVYGWSRHPSYFAFFYWALATQIVVGNGVAFLAFIYILYRFFEHRIRVEEWYLIKFFGDDYVRYKAEVPTRIPFIP